MKIHTEILLKENRWCVRIDVNDFSAVEEEKLLQFGDPLIETGGSFKGMYDNVAVDYSLPTDPRRLTNDFPVCKCFDREDYEDAEERAVVFRLTLEQRIRQARAVLLSREARAVGGTSYSINLVDNNVAGIYSQNGSQPIDDDVNSVVVSFPEEFASSPNSFILDVVNAQDNTPLSISASLSSLDMNAGQNGQMTVSLSATTDSANYILNWNATVI